MNGANFEDEWFPDDIAEDEGAALRHSKRLDVHRWSDHPEVTSLVDEVYQLLRQTGNARIRKRHLKVVLLDLYVNWWADPTLKTTYSRSPNSYNAGSIYNELHISRVTINVVDWLEESGLVEHRTGFYNKATKKGFNSRLWPTEALTDRFKEARFSIYDLGYDENRVAVVLKDTEKKEEEYHPTPETNAMEVDLKRYNQLLHRTFILPHSLDSPRLESNASSLNFAHQQSKFTYRVFNRSSFSLGGRFYGGWWSTCKKALRNDILINDASSIEIDFGSLHPNLLYAREGIDMWAEMKNGPYSIEPVSFEVKEDGLRQLAKQLMLILLNVDKVAVVCSAFRYAQDSGSPYKKLKDKEIFEVVDQLFGIHTSISGYFTSGVSLELQFVDSKIAARIVNHFTDLDVPVLVVHDSFIVPQGWEDDLEAIMDLAFKAETDSDFSSQLKFEGRTFAQVEEELQQRLDARNWIKDEAADSDELQIYEEVYPTRTDWYQSELHAFNRWKTDTAEQ